MMSTNMLLIQKKSLIALSAERLIVVEIVFVWTFDISYLLLYP
jgi:hypothetical protein